MKCFLCVVASLCTSYSTINFTLGERDGTGSALNEEDNGNNLLNYATKLVIEKTETMLLRDSDHKRISHVSDWRPTSMGCCMSLKMRSCA